MSSGTGIVVRGVKRHEIVIPGRWCVGEVHSSALRLGAASGHRSGWIELDAVDVSGGGIGVMSSLFVPKGAVMRVQLFMPTAGADSEPLIDVCVRVRRVAMTDRRPAYLHGTSFEDLSEEQQQAVDALLDRLEGE